MFRPAFVCALLLCLATSSTWAIPLHISGELGSSVPGSISPITAALSLLPLPLLAAVKYAYIRFRRGQSIHQHAHTSSGTDLSPVSSPVLSSRRSVLTGFWEFFTPYLVGLLGSPEWETRIRSRLDRTLRQAKSQADSRRSSRRTSPPYSLALADSSRTTANTSTAYYSSLSHKSRSRSKSISVSFGDISGSCQPMYFGRHDVSAITDCAIVHPSTPPCSHAVPLPVLPEPVYVPAKAPPQDGSPTLMQMMEPVLRSWYDDHGKSRSTEYSSQLTSTSVDKAGLSIDSPSIPFQTPLTSPGSPVMVGAYPDSVPSLPFALLRKQLGVSATSSVLSLAAATFSSPASFSLAVFHSPAAPSIPVPKPVYTPIIRPESCAVLPVDWRNERDRLSANGLLHSPTHRSPASGAHVSIFDILSNPPSRPTKSPKVTFSPTFAPPASPAPVQSSSSGQVVLKSALKKRTSDAGTSPVIPSSLRNSVSFSMLSLEVPGPAGGAVTVGSSAASMLSVYSGVNLTSTGTDSKDRQSWDLSDLMCNGQLDVDEVTRVLGLGLGMPGIAVGSRSSVGSVGSATNAALGLPPPDRVDPTLGSVLSETQAEVLDTDTGYDVDQYATGWGSPRLESMQLSMTHVHGAPLCVIPEETQSEVCSIAGSVHMHVGERETGGARRESGTVPMELDSVFLAREELRARRDTIGSFSVGGESWREGESLMTLNVGVAW
ncbi:hypothetical protein GY45DRAFT_1364814 [Cubamyces sp. BRFM 1775]|nr:hypothetical protein GY45DRAFT_1364814 [Cubamyces sp. BRFM 1775]